LAQAFGPKPCRRLKKSSVVGSPIFVEQKSHNPKTQKSVSGA